MISSIVSAATEADPRERTVAGRVTSAYRITHADAIARYYAAVYDDDERWQFVYDRAFAWAMRFLERREEREGR